MTERRLVPPTASDIMKAQARQDVRLERLRVRFLKSLDPLLEHIHSRVTSEMKKNEGRNDGRKG